MNKGMIFLSMLLVSPASAAPDLPTNVTERRLATEVLWKGLRDLKATERPRVILVLGGGGARGLSHIGTLRVVEEEGIPVDEIVGVSVGALIGSLYAAGRSVDEIESMTHEIGWDKLTDFSKSNLMRLMLSDELLSTKRMEDYINRQMGEKRFEDLKIPFTCAATDIRTGERVIFKEGPVAIAARASATIPGIFKPVEYRQRLLVDGGLVGSLPTDVIGPKTPNVFVIGVLPTAEEDIIEQSTVLKSLIRTIDIQKSVISSDRKASTDFMVEPNVGPVSLIDLDKSESCITAGTIATRKAALDIKVALLKKYREMKTHRTANQ